MANHLPHLSSCPVCKRRPLVDQCGPWPKGLGDPPWYIGCYQMFGENEHFIGVNADTKREAMLKWNAEVERALHPTPESK